MTSSNGINWTLIPINSILIYSITFGNGIFVAVGIGGSALTSNDGITWDTHTVPLEYWASITYGNGLFVAVGEDVMTSTNGVTWNYIQLTNNETPTWNSITFGNGLFVAVSRSAVINKIMTSSDGTTWNFIQPPEDNNWTSIAYGDGLFVSVARDGINRIMTSGILTNSNIISFKNNTLSLSNPIEEENLNIMSNGDVFNKNGTYGVLSDIRLKENIIPAQSQIEDIKNLNFVNYNMIGDNKNMIGLIAQEVEKICPYLVDNSAKYKKVKVSILYMKSAKALQELINKVEILENEIKELKNNA